MFSLSWNGCYPFCILMFSTLKIDPVAVTCGICHNFHSQSNEVLFKITRFHDNAWKIVCKCCWSFCCCRGIWWVERIFFYSAAHQKKNGSTFIFCTRVYRLQQPWCVDRRFLPEFSFPKNDYILEIVLTKTSCKMKHWLIWTHLDSFWTHFGLILDSFWTHFGLILDSFGLFLASFWTHFGLILDSF